MKKSILFSLLILALSSCQNQDWEFDDFDYSTVYFAYQYPVRTLTMGEDIYNTDLDNAHKCKIMATWGGGYGNKKNVVIDIKVDESLCNNVLYKDNNQDILPMPSAYYQLASNQIVIPKGEISGGVEVQLTDAFFADPLALQRNYVIPVVMQQAQNVDSILRGKTSVSEPNRCNADDWTVVPKDYLLYAVKYINKWTGFYSRRGTDVIIKDNGAAKTEVRHQKYVEDDEICGLNTMSLSETEFPITYESETGIHLSVPIVLDFNDDDCTITEKESSIQISDSVRIYNITSQGNGKFVKKGEKNSWGNKDRDVLHLDYKVGFDVELTFPTSNQPTVNERYDYATKDTLVARDRGVSMETYEVVMK